MTDHPFEPPLTLFGLPFATGFAGQRVVAFGIPFDCGIDPTRLGARLGPNAVRHASTLTATLLADASPNPLARVPAVDAGNVPVAGRDIHAAFEAVERAARAVVDAGAVPLALGGDGAVSLPLLRAVAAKHGPLAALHFDAHTDAWPLRGNDHYDNSNQFTHAVNEGLVDADASIHVGIRGPVNAGRAVDHARGLGYEVIPFEQYREWGAARLLGHLHHRLAGRSVYLCFDMDFFDPGVAPGVATPTPGGALADEGLRLLRGLAGLRFAALDINTTSPLHDPAGATAVLAASVAAECLALVAAPATG